jgi:preprotein translocase subunit YajC
MNSLIPEAMAQTAGGGAAGAGQSPMGMVIMMVGFVVIFYFLLIRPQQKKQKEHQAMLSKIGEGDEVVTAGGILGKVVGVGDQFLTIEIADGVRIKVQRFQVTSLVPKGTLKGA